MRAYSSIDLKARYVVACGKIKAENNCKTTGMTTFMWGD